MNEAAEKVFAPTVRVIVETLSGLRSFEAECFGALVVVQSELVGGVPHSSYTVLIASTSRALASFWTLHVARNFAGEMDRLYDFEALSSDGRPLADTHPDIYKEIDNRRKHPDLVIGTYGKRVNTRGTPS